jgi:predicted metalloprotease with PDZ domain
MRKNSRDRRWFGRIATVILCGVLFLAASPGATEQQKEGPREQIFQLLTGLGTDIGVTARDLNASEIREPSLTSGAVLEDVRKDSPASRAGIRKGDIVVAFDGEIIHSGRQFARVVRETVPGKTVQTTIVREGHKRELSITVPLGSTRRR